MEAGLSAAASPETLVLRVVIPGPPQPQQRVKATIRGAHAGVYEPKQSRSWKGQAQVHMQAAVYARTGRDVPPWPIELPLAVHIIAVFACPASDCKKRVPTPRRWHTKANADADNLAKCVLDAGNGALFFDDRQVARLTVEKRIGAQGEAPRVEVQVAAIEGAA